MVQLELLISFGFCLFKIVGPGPVCVLGKHSFVVSIKKKKTFEPDMVVPTCNPSSLGVEA